MGGKSTKSIDDEMEVPLDSTIIELGIDEIDRTCSKAVTLIQEVEEFRKILIESRYDLYILSGSCSYLRPDIFKTIHCIMWKVATDNEGQVDKVKVEVSTKDFPYLSLYGEELTVYSMAALGHLAKYIEAIKLLEIKIESIAHSIHRLFEIGFGKGMEGFNDMIIAFNLNNTKERRRLAKIYHGNMRRVKIAATIGRSLINEYKNVYSDIFLGLKSIQDPSFQRKLKDIGQNAKYKSLFTSHEIAFSNINKKERVATHNRGFRIWNDKGIAVITREKDLIKRKEDELNGEDKDEDIVLNKEKMKKSGGK